MKITYFTKEGLEKLQNEKQNLESIRPEAVNDLKRAREMGDLSENGFYKGARAKLSQIDSRLRRLVDLIKRAKIIEHKHSAIVEIGSTVILQQKQNKITYTIVGQYEANPRESKISHLSPIGRELLGKTAGTTIIIETPSGRDEYTILQVN